MCAFVENILFLFLFVLDIIVAHKQTRSHLAMMCMYVGGRPLIICPDFRKRNFFLTSSDQFNFILFSSFFWQPCDHFFRDAPNNVFFFNSDHAPPDDLLMVDPLLFYLKIYIL